MNVIRRLLAVASSLLALGGLPASLDAQPPERSTEGRVLGTGIVTGFVEDMDRSLAFYRDAFGMEVPAAPADGHRPYNPSNSQLFAMFDIRGARERHEHATVPGSAVRFELMEIQDVPHNTVELRPQDPGAMTLVFYTDDIDAALERALAAGAEISTPGGGPVAQSAGYRAVLLRDVDGRPVELRESGGDGAATITDMRLSLAVADLDRTVAVYRDVLGFSTGADESGDVDADIESLTGLSVTDAARTVAVAPAETLRIEFVDYRGVEREPLSMRIQDRGAARVQIRAEHLDALVDSMRGAGLRIVSEGGGPVPIPPNFLGALVADPNGFFLTPFAPCDACAPRLVPEASETSLRVERLAIEVERTESLRDIKTLQHAYSQYAQAGLWSEMAALFADDGELVYGEETIRGRSAIGRYFLEELGNGREGLPPGGVRAHIIDRPVVNLAADGQSAKGRWVEFTMFGSPGRQAGWAGGIQTNDYVREDGVWKLARLHYHPQLAGSYADGWTALESDIDIVPYHFDAEEAGAPIPELPAALTPTSSSASTEETAARLADLERRAGAMVDRDRVQNLYNAYGYYLDRKMWDDVTDLFTADGVLAIDGIGIYRGIPSIRRGLERDGPAGLRRGEMNDHVFFNTLVEISPSGHEARTRGLEMMLEGDTDTQSASIAVIVNEGLYEKRDDRWRIREVRSFPAARTDYYKGWAESALDEPAPTSGHEPDEELAERDSEQPSVVDFFYPHPVTGREIRLPDGTRMIGAVMPFAKASTPTQTTDESKRIEQRVAEVERQMRVARAYDGVENISGAFGDWLDDFQWDKFSALFAEDGRRRKYMLGFYTGPKRILAAETMMYGEGPSSPRTSVAVHHRLQRVIDVAPDGLSAKLRTRLLNIGMSARPGSFMAGMYPNDAARLESGVWKFMNSSIDEPYWSSRSYAEGWARVPEPEPASSPPDAEPPTLSPRFARLLDELPPDIPLAAMPNRQYGFVPGAIISWPDIKPMWFHYLNPVSGREPDYYCPDEFTCEAMLEEKLSRRRQGPLPISD